MIYVHTVIRNGASSLP